MYHPSDEISIRRDLDACRSLFDKKKKKIQSNEIRIIATKEYAVESCDFPTSLFNSLPFSATVSGEIEESLI